jgi:DUF917 family protein
MQLTDEALEHLATGTTILGAGGGGDPRVGLLMAKQAIRDFGPVELVRPDELDPDDLVVPGGLMGAPTVMLEKLPNGRESEVIKSTLETRLGRKVGAFMCLEMGGINGILAVAWAARAGLPLVDCDLMGRAFPQADMCVPHIYGMSASPTVLVDERMQVVLFEAVDNMWLERLARGISSEMGGYGTVVLYPMTAADAARVAIQGTVSTAIEIGRTLATSGKPPLEALNEVLPTYVLLRGKVVDVERRTAGGFVRGSAVIEGLGADAGRTVRVEFQNENLIVLEDGRPLATVPDIITALDTHTAQTITTEQLRYGHRVVLAVFPSPDVWRTPAGLAVVGPRAFGYDVDYQPIEEQHVAAV